MMATERIESGRLQLQAPGTVPMQQITPRDTDFVGYQAQAQSASTLSQLIDRMSQTAFQFAGEAAKERALVDVANQRLTPQQLELAARGDMSMLAGGSPFNIYDATVRKARSMELAGHFDTEAKGEVVRLMAEIDAGRMTSEQAAQKLNTMTTGFSRALAKVDADAAIKFTAQTGIYGHTLMAEAYKRERDEQRKRTSAQVAVDFQNTTTLINSTLRQGFLVDQNGNQVPADVTALQIANDFLNKAFASGEGQQYAPKVAAMLREAKVNVLTELVVSDQYLPQGLNALNRIRAGDLGALSGIWASLPQDDREVVLKNFATANSQRRTMADDEQRENKRLRDEASVPLLIEFHAPSTTARRRQAIALELTNLRVLSIEQIEKFLDPKAQPGDPYVFANIETRVARGEITDSDELRRIAARAGMNGQQYAQLNQPILRQLDKNAAEAKSYLRRVSGVPDVVSTFATKDDQHKLDKERRLNEAWQSSIDAFRQSNPGMPVPFVELARQAETNYNNTEKQDATKTKARNELGNYVKELIQKRKVPEGFVIDENTNIDDLVARGIIPKDDKNNTAEYIRRRQEILRRVAQ